MALAKERIAWFVIAGAIGVVAAVFGQPLIHGNDQAVEIIVTTFSILAGFLVAIMTILGDPGAMARASWRGVEVKRSAVFTRLVRQKWLFILYLMILGLTLAASLAAQRFYALAIALEHLYLGLAATAFVLSLGLPSALMDIQLGRLDELIQKKRRHSGIVNDPASEESKN